MLSSRKQAQHTRGVSTITRLAEKLAIDNNYGVSAEYDIVRTLTCYCQRLFAR